MTARRRSPRNAATQNAPNAVNTFTNVLAIRPFHGDGRRRIRARSAAAQERRNVSATIAEMLVMGGIDPNEVYRADADTSDIVFALDGSTLRDCLGRPRRAWLGYPDHAHAQKTRIGREYTLFAEERGIRRVIQVVVRPPSSSMPLTELAERHGRHSETLGYMLRYARRSRASEFAWDLIAAEFRKLSGDGWTIDGHFHLTVRGADEDALERIQAYFEKRGWAFWFTPDEDSGNHPSALAQYLAKNLAATIDTGEGWSPEALAELRRQTRNLSLVRATGAFREWKGELAEKKLIVAEDKHGKPFLASQRIAGDRLRPKLCNSSSVTALRFCVHDFGDGLFRRSILVRGGAGTSLAEIANTYDLDDTFLKENTAIPKSLTTPSSQIVSIRTPDPPNHGPPGRDEEKIPW